MSEHGKKSLTWEEVRERCDKVVVTKAEDWIKIAGIYDLMDRSTIPPNVKFPDLRPDDVRESKDIELPGQE